MSNNLVKRLRISHQTSLRKDNPNYNTPYQVIICAEAADHIEALEKARDGAYTERNRLVAYLANLFPSGIKKTDISGWDEAWHGCVYIDLPTGQASWHYHENEAHLFAHLPPYKSDWDGHTTEEKYERLFLAASHAKQKDELLADYIKFAEALVAQTNKQDAHIKALEKALREIYEVYAGSEGIPQPMNAAEGYLLHLVKEMVTTARAALEGKDE